MSRRVRRYQDRESGLQKSARFDSALELVSQYKGLQILAPVKTLHQRPHLSSKAGPPLSPSSNLRPLITKVPPRLLSPRIQVAPHHSRKAAQQQTPAIKTKLAQIASEGQTGQRVTIDCYASFFGGETGRPHRSSLAIIQEKSMIATRSQKSTMTAMSEDVSAHGGGSYGMQRHWQQYLLRSCIHELHIMMTSSLRRMQLC